MSKENKNLKSNINPNQASSRIGSTSFEEIFRLNNPNKDCLKLKKLKIIKNPLTISLDKVIHCNTKKNAQIFSYQTINKEREINLNLKNITPTYKALHNKSELPFMNNKNGRLTFDGVFNKQDTKKINRIPYNIPPIVIGNFQNQPHINININNFNINNYSSNRLKESINLSNKKIYEPVKIITKPFDINEQRPESRISRINFVKQDLFIDEDSKSIPPSNSNIIKMNKKVKTR
jgi:hypothetical protein